MKGAAPEWDMAASVPKPEISVENILAEYGDDDRYELIDIDAEMGDTATRRILAIGDPRVAASISTCRSRTQLLIQPPDCHRSQVMTGAKGAQGGDCFWGAKL